MSLRSFLMLLLIALIGAFGAAEVSSAESGTPKWPEQAHLKSQIEQCHLSKPPEGIPENETRAATLDYERQCYRQLMEIEHAQLNALQDAISKNRARKMAFQTLLESKPLPKCQLSKPLEAVPEKEARIATLDYENQCYRQLAEMERGKLDALQKVAREMAKSPTPKHHIAHRRLARRQLFMTYFQATR
jgi:hypothetical protein